VSNPLFLPYCLWNNKHYCSS